MNPLASYRRTGADLPFGDPRRAHGTRFEGYYWRLTDSRPAAWRSCCAACAAMRRGRGRSWRYASDGVVRSRIEPLAEVSFGGLGVRAGATLSASAERLRVDLGPTRGSSCASRNGGVAAGPFGGIGPAQIVPGLPQYWHPHLLGGRVVGSGLGRRDRLRGEELGAALHRALVVGPGAGVRGADACVAFAGGRVLGGAPTSVVVRVEDRRAALAPPFAALTTAVGAAGWRVRARSPRWTVELEGAAAGSPAVLPVPVPGSGVSRTARSSTWRGRCACACGAGGGLWWRGASRVAGLERWM